LLKKTNHFTQLPDSHPFQHINVFRQRGLGFPLKGRRNQFIHPCRASSTSKSGGINPVACNHSDFIQIPHVDDRQFPVSDPKCNRLRYSQLKSFSLLTADSTDRNIFFRNQIFLLILSVPSVVRIYQTSLSVEDPNTLPELKKNAFSQQKRFPFRHSLIE